MQTTLTEVTRVEERDSQPPGPVRPIVPYDSHPPSAAPTAQLATPQPVGSIPAISPNRVDPVVIAIAAVCGGLFTFMVLPTWGRY